MANQILTNYCNAGCDFCFASDFRSKLRDEELLQMEEEDVRSYLDFTLRAGIKELRLLGGEPTLHPRFADFVKMGREAGCTIRVFSNGVMPDASRVALAALDPEVCAVVINFNAAIRPEDCQRRRDTLEMLGPRVSPGVTLTSPVFSFLQIVEAIEAFGMRKTIRIGLSHPTWRGTNTALHPKRYAAAAASLLEQSYLTARHGISLDADCGFVRCMFGGIFDKLKENGFHYISRCTPVLDLCAGGRIIPCFALSELISLRKEDHDSAKETFSTLTERLKSFRSFGIYPECGKCVFFETSECCGGCAAARLRRLQPMGSS